MYQFLDEVTKNHREDNVTYGGQMYESQDDPLCPVRTFQLYRSLLHQDCNNLFQRAKSGVYHVGERMFDNCKVGQVTLGNLMRKMSEAAGLSRKYTNHCICATSITLLDENFDPTTIMGVSMHKSLSSVMSYRARIKKSKKRDMSLSLTRACRATSASDIASSDVASAADITSPDVASAPDITLPVSDSLHVASVASSHAASASHIASSHAASASHIESSHAASAPHIASSHAASASHIALPHVASATHIATPHVALNSTFSGENLYEMDDDFDNVLQNIDLEQYLPQNVAPVQNIQGNTIVVNNYYYYR